MNEEALRALVRDAVARQLTGQARQEPVVTSPVTLVTHASHYRYALPESGLPRWLGRMLGARYARWCTRRMANGAATHFEKPLSGVDRPSDVYEMGGLA